MLIIPACKIIRHFVTLRSKERSHFPWVTIILRKVTDVNGFLHSRIRGLNQLHRGYLKWSNSTDWRPSYPITIPLKLATRIGHPATTPAESAPSCRPAPLETKSVITEPGHPAAPELCHSGKGRSLALTFRSKDPGWINLDSADLVNVPMHGRKMALHKVNVRFSNI